MRPRSDLSSTSPDSGSLRGRTAATAGSLTTLAVLTTGCDPVINFYGSFFPGWVIALVLGIVLCVLSRWILAWVRLEPHLGPLILVYPALTFLWACASWLVLFGP
ncbi:MAG: hypothetical protein J0M24_19680 [Verrucomicrobia bacterium]|nr:hypothetical protein [Verrucomicrobiota bacterium]